MTGDFIHEQCVGESIDNLVTTDMRFRGFLTNVIKPFLKAAQEAEGGSVSFAAGRSLVNTVEPGDTVIIATGAGKGRVNIPHGETDGPPGAVGIARAVALGLDARPILTVEEHCVESTQATIRAGGLNVVTWEEHQERQNATTLIPYSKDQTAGEAAASDFFDQYDPSAVIAVEKGGPNQQGVYHSALGTDMTSGRAKVAPLFDRAAEESVLTIGIGDNGNEIGYGKIEEAVREIHPHGDVCECSCGGGIVTRVATDHLIPANVSNWGAYGLQAMVALLTENSVVMHTPDDERRMLEQNILAGSNDGVYDRPVMKVDGTSLDTQQGMISILNNIVTNGLSQPPDRGF